MGKEPMTEQVVRNAAAGLAALVEQAAERALVAERGVAIIYDRGGLTVLVTKFVPYGEIGEFPSLAAWLGYIETRHS